MSVPLCWLRVLRRLAVALFHAARLGRRAQTATRLVSDIGENLLCQILFLGFVALCIRCGHFGDAEEQLSRR